MSLTGAVNGTNGVIIKIDGTESTIVGQMEFTTTFTGQPIDVSNKSSDDWVCLMDGELSGKGETAAGTILYNSDATYRDVRADTVVGTIGQYKVDFGDGINNLYFDAIPNALSDSVPMGDKIGSSITFTSTGAIFGPSNPSLGLDFENERYSQIGINGGSQLSQLDDILTNATRNSTATYYDASGVIQEAAIDELRISYDGETGQKGVLLESSASNLVLYNTDLSNAVWNKFQSTIGSGTGTNPDGSATVQKLIANDGFTGTLLQLVSVTSGNDYCLSVFIKADEVTEVSMELPAAQFGTDQSITVDLSTGTITAQTATYAYLEPLSNGWYRMAVAAQCTTSGSTQARHAQVAVGNGSDGLFVFGGQLEEGTRPTSLIFTDATQVTRATDNFSVLTGDWFDSNNGCLFVEYVEKDNGDDEVNYAALTDNTANERFSIDSQSGVNIRGRHIESSNDTIVTFGTGTVNELSRAAFVYDSSLNVKGSANGAATVSDTVSAQSSKTVLNLGGRNSGADGAKTIITKINYFPIAFTNEEIEAMTS